MFARWNRQQGLTRFGVPAAVPTDGCVRQVDVARSSVDYVRLADGAVVAVPWANLAAAKALLAAQKAAERRVALAGKPKRHVSAAITELPVLVRAERMAS